MLEIRSTLSGSVIEILVEAGDIVSAGQPLIIIEALKNLVPIQAQSNMIIQDIRVREQEQVEAGALLFRGKEVLGS